VNRATGQPIPVRQSYQKPRERRFVLGVRFWDLHRVRVERGERLAVAG
jgi:hypothetical protein